jgi:hypothetical protein
MQRTVDAANFTGQTLAWFEEGEVLAASERAAAAEPTLYIRRRRSHPFFTALVVLMVLALLGFAGILAADYFGIALPFELPWEIKKLPWN